MSSVIKVNACVYSRKGYSRQSNTNSFYMNGKFISEQHIENVQASMENRGIEYLFAVSDNMICDYPDREIYISILKELGKYHEKITVNDGDIRSKIDELELRVNDTQRLISSVLEVNKVPEEDPIQNLDFAGLLLSEGKLVALSNAEGRIYMMRDGRFRPLAADASRAKREIDNLAKEEEDDSDISLPGDEDKGSVVVSDIYNINEDDSFILLSKGLYDALGEEKIEDLLALRSDSSFIAYRLVDEAMKRKSVGDITALVVQVEKVINQQGGLTRKAPARTQPKQAKQRMQSRVDRLNKVPAVTYKYNKRKTKKLQSNLYTMVVIVSVLVLFAVLFFMLKSLVDTGKNSLPSPPATNTIEPTDTATPMPTPTPTETPTPTPEATPVAIQTHIVKKGDSMSSISRTYYGDIALMEALCKYNNISNPNTIVLGQEIKIPPKEELLNQ